MSVTVAKGDGVTVFILTSDHESPCPPICHLLSGLCVTPGCCSVSQRLRTVQPLSQSVLGALHIMVGLLNIGLGATLVRPEAHYFWLGAMFLLFGIVSILSEKYPSPCLVILNVVLNLAGIGFAIAAIVLHSISIAVQSLWWMCEDDYYYSSRYDTPSPREKVLTEMCLEGKTLILMIQQSILIVLIVLSVLELCVVISSAVLGIKALRSSEKRENKSMDDPEHYKALLKEVSSNPAA